MSVRPRPISNADGRTFPKNKKGDFFESLGGSDVSCGGAVSPGWVAFDDITEITEPWLKSAVSVCSEGGPLLFLADDDDGGALISAATVTISSLALPGLLPLLPLLPLVAHTAEGEDGAGSSRFFPVSLRRNDGSSNMRVAYVAAPFPTFCGRTRLIIRWLNTDNAVSGFC